MGVIVTLELGLWTNCPPAGGSAALFLSSNLSLLSKRNSLPISSLARDLPSLAATTGRAAAQPFAGDERVLQVCRASPPSLSLCCAKRSTPNPNKTICIRI